MSLRRRLLLYLLVCAPLVWAMAVAVSVHQALHEVNELFDSELIRLARQVQTTLGSPVGAGVGAPVPLPAPPRAGSREAGESDVQDLAIAVWNAAGERMLSDREGADLIHRPDAVGFYDDVLNGNAWRVYYLQSTTGEWLVAAGQRAYERRNLAWGLTGSQLVPWLATLPLLMLLMTWGVGRALRPVRQLTDEIHNRDAADLRPVPADHVPSELQPLATAMNALFGRIDAAVKRERRFTADAAHELRTPLAVLRARFDVMRRSASPAEREAAEAKLAQGLDRMDRLVTQMLLLSRVEADVRPVVTDAVDWASAVEAAVSDTLTLAERRGIEIACEWPDPAQPVFPLAGNPDLLTALLRNLLDNAVRYAPPASLVELRFSTDTLTVDNDGEPLTDAQRARIGERFYRPDGQQESGSGLGASIVQRIAALHGLTVRFDARPDGRGMRVTVARGTRATAADRVSEP